MVTHEVDTYYSEIGVILLDFTCTYTDFGFHEPVWTWSGWTRLGCLFVFSTGDDFGYYEGPSGF